MRTLPNRARCFERCWTCCGRQWAAHLKEMTARLVMANGIDPTDEKLCRMMHKRVGTAMRTLKTKGMARYERGHGLNLLWVAVET